MDQFYEQAQQILLYVMMVATPMYLINRLQTDSLAGKLLINSISFVMCITFTWLVILFCSFMYVINGLFTIMLPAVIALLLFCAYRVMRERGLDKRFVYLFLGYAVAIFVVTLFARIGMSNNEIRVDVVPSIVNALTLRDPGAAEHLSLNTVMFIPFGALYMMMAPRKTEKVKYNKYGRVEYQPVRYISAAFFLGLDYSGVIESSQLVLSMGECDMADVFANALGTLIGAFAGKIIRRFIR